MKEVTITMKFEVDDSTEEGKKGLAEVLDFTQEEFLEEYDGTDGIKGISINVESN